MERAQAEEQAYTVTQAMNAAKRGLEKIRLTVVGEVSEFNDRPGYKAAYFTVRDDGCAMPCLMWRNQYDASGVQLRCGMLVELTGYFSCYAAKGRMQFSVNRLRLAGEGNLRMQVAQIARKLEAEGLMDPSRKRRPPALPRRIAVVTSPRGKAVHDVLRTLRRRYPLGEVLLFGVPVEGAQAPQYLRDALAAAAAPEHAADVILLVRGGGSYEDLMPFNDEQLARAVAASPVPVVTGIGHEPDNSVCDMCADVRCSTPTAAAEGIAPSVEELQVKVGNATRALGSALVSRIAAADAQLSRLAAHPLWRDDRYMTGPCFQTLDMMGERLARAIPNAMEQDARSLASLRERLAAAAAGVGAPQDGELQRCAERLAGAGHAFGGQQAGELQRQHMRLVAAGSRLVEARERQVALAAAKLDALSPLKTLGRGYSITYAADGRTVVDRVDKTAVGQGISVQVQDGTVHATVDGIERS